MFFEHTPDDPGVPAREQFTGTAPLFPLGNLTLLPNVVQPFHMFEPRYRKLAEDAVEGDGFITLGILKPDGGAAYESKEAAVYPAACLGRIMQYEPLPGGRWNLIVQGLWRVQITGEQNDNRQYRTAALEVVDEHPAEDVPSYDVAARRHDLIELFAKAQPKLAAYPAIRDVLEQDLPIGLLTDFIAHALDLSPASGAVLLGEPCAATRCEFLTAMLRAHVKKKTGETDRPFPPEFSAN